MSKLTCTIVVCLLQCLIWCHLTVATPCNTEMPSIDAKTENSEVIANGRVLRLLTDLRTQDNYIPADVIITEVYKGYPLFHNVSAVTLRPPHETITNVYRIGNFKLHSCLEEISTHEKYLFFLTTGQMSESPQDSTGELSSQSGTVGREHIPESGLQLQPKYDETVVDPLEKFSLAKEKEVLTTLGWKQWTSWTHCSIQCGVGGTQSRRRTCTKDEPYACEGDAMEERPCNKFSCSQMRDMMFRMNLQGVEHVRFTKNRDNAFFISPRASITILTSMIYTHDFPGEFSILLVLRPKVSGKSSANSNLYPLVITDDERRLQLAIRIANRQLAILFGTPQGIRTISFTGYQVNNRDWHYLAFAIRRDSITLIADCSQKFIHNLPVGDEVYVDTSGFASIGNPTNGVEGLDNIKFSGDIEQFVILEDPDAADLQCSDHKRMLPVPPLSLFDDYPAPDVGNADVPFDVDPMLVNPAFIPSTETPVARVPTTHPLGMELTNLWTTEAITTNTPIERENNIPPVEITPDGVKGVKVLPARGDKPDMVIKTEVMQQSSTEEPKEQLSSSIRTTKAPKILPPKITMTKVEESTIYGQAAVVPDNTKSISPDGDVSPPGDGNLVDKGELFEDDEFSGSEAYNDVGVQWSTWSTCTTTCGLGTRYRFGFCQQDSTYLDCQRGRTITAQRKNCQLNNCPGRLQWSDWSSCSRSCGDNSVRTRMAFCPDESAHIDCMRPGQTVVEREACDVPQCQDICQEECQNGGRCHYGACACPPGYTGEFCQHQTCSPQCRNGGTCVGNNICECPEATFGPYCTRRCVPDCENGAECTYGNRCQCPSGFHGFRCEFPTCTHPCQNGGRCIGPDKCHCQQGYSGEDCSIPQCSPGCENGGQCVRPDFCRCPTAYRGPRCEIAKCPRGCPPSMTCVGHNRCVPKTLAGKSHTHSGGKKTWCRLQLHNQRVQTSYVKPVIRSTQISCGAFGLQRCNSQRLEYTIGYRTAYKTSYRCANSG